MITRTQKIRLGVFFAVGSILILIFIGVVAGTKFFVRHDVYYIQFEDVSVSGLQVGGQVLYHGVEVGRVDEIKINPQDVSKVIVTISVDEGTPIKSDVKATLVFVGITGIKSIELMGGTNEAEPIKPGTFIPAGVSKIESITGKAESIAEKIEQVALNLTNLTNAENQRNIAEILQNSNLLLSDTRESLSQTLNSLNIIAASVSEITTSTSSGLNTLTESTNLLVLDTRDQINKIGDNSNKLILQATNDMTSMTLSINQSLSRINQLVSAPQFDSLLVNANVISGKLASADLKQLVTDLNATIIQTNGLVSNLDRTVSRGRTDLLDTLESLSEAAANLNEFTKQISENPSSLFIGR